MRLDAARRLMAEGRHEEADRLADDMLFDAPRDIEALLVKGATALARGDRERAFALFGNLAQEAPGRADICANLGLLHRLEDRGAEARLCYERAVDLAPEDGAYRCALVGILLSLGDLDAARAHMLALADLPAALHDSALQAEIFGLDARIALLENRPAAAERAARRALGLRPDHEDDLALLSDALAQLGRPEEALAAAEAAYLRAPASHDGTCLLARRLMELGRMDEAERHLRRTAAAAPFHGDAAYLLARLQIAKGEGEAGVSRFAALVRRAPSDPDLLMRMATLLRLTGQTEQALVCAAQAARAAPAGSSYEVWRDELKLALGQVEAVWPAVNAPVVPPAVQVPPSMPAGEALLLARFARRAGADGAPPVCHADAALLPVLDGIPGLRLTGAEPDAAAVALNELPRLTGVQPADLDAAPYLAVEAGRLEDWAQALADRPRPFIGLMWDEASGASFGAMLDFVGRTAPGAGTLLSLAFDGRRDELARHPSVLDAGANFRDARDLVALVAHLDLVLAADSLAAHVAGALGRPGIVAVPPARPWAWADRAARSLWYPSLRVACPPRPAAMGEALAAHAEFVRAVLGIRKTERA